MVRIYCAVVGSVMMSRTTQKLWHITQFYVLRQIDFYIYQ